MKVRIGISLGPVAVPAVFGDAVDRVEELGVDSLWLSEMVFGSLVEPFAGMAYALSRTARLKVGTGVAVLPGRWPARGDERGGVAAGPALAYGGSKVGGNNATGCDGKTDPEVVGLNLAARGRGGGLDGFPCGPRLLGGQQAAQPSVGKPANAAQRAGGAAA